MPANNRVSTSSTLKTHGIWSNVIGYDPYASQTPEATAAGGAAGGGGASASILERAQRAKADEVGPRAELAVEGVKDATLRLPLEAAVAMGWRAGDLHRDLMRGAGGVGKEVKGLAAFAADAKGVHLDDVRALSPSDDSSDSSSSDTDSSEERAREERRKQRKRERKERKKEKKRDKEEKKRRRKEKKVEEGEKKE
jgi:hypothetical protein